MTVGNYEWVNSPGTGRYAVLTWVGDDRPKVAKPKAEYRYVQRGKKTYRVRTNWNVYRPVKRELLAPHNFQKTWNFVYGGDPREYTNNWNEKSTHTAINLGQTDPGYSGMCSTNINGYPYYQSMFDGNDLAKMLGKLREKLYGSDFNMSVFLGEGHQTLGLIADTALRLRKSIVQLKRGDLRGAASFLLEGTGRKIRGIPLRKRGSSSLSQNWLELQYGWLPLLGDAHDAGQQLAHALNVPFRKKYSVRSERQVTTEHNGGLNGPYADGRYSYKWFRHGRFELTYYAQETPSMPAVLGLLDPELVAWELMPWSFVIDWFLPVGQYLEARAFSSHLSGTFVYNLTHQGVWLGCEGALSNGNAYARRGSSTRVVSNQPWTVPLPSLKGLAKVASWQHCANAIALLAQLKR